MLSRASVTTLFLLLSDAVVAQHSVRQAPTWVGFDALKYWFAFGDSYSWTSFDVDGLQPNASNPLGNPAYASITTSNGPNYVDYLTTSYNASYIQTYNLAFAGATISESIAPQLTTSVRSATDQVDTTFQKYLQQTGTVNWTAPDTLFSLWFGINDVLTYYQTNASSVLQADMDQYKLLIETIYLYGGRNILLLNVPPIDRAPINVGLNSSALEALQSDIRNFNLGLANITYQLQHEHSDATFVLHDTYTLFTRALDDVTTFPQTAMILNTTSYCDAYTTMYDRPDAFNASCDIRSDQYFWFNYLHPTTPIHEALASNIAQVLSSPSVTAIPSAAPSAVPTSDSLSSTTAETSSAPSPGNTQITRSSAARLDISGPALIRGIIMVVLTCI